MNDIKPNIKPACINFSSGPCTKRPGWSVNSLDGAHLARSHRRKLGKEKLVLMSSHILQEIQATVDRIIIINNGEIVADGTSDDLISGSKGMTQLHLEIQNADENSIQDMKAVIPSISIESIHKMSNSIQVTLEHSSTSDPRKDVFDYAVNHEWTLVEMSTSKRNLEDIFRHLTQEGGSAHA
mgnify:CR=1 FL=1